MRTPLVFIAFIFLTANAYAQPKGIYERDSIDMLKVKTLKVALDTPSILTTNINFPFSFIQVKDVRYDTTQLGLYSVFSDVFVRIINNYRINIDKGVSYGFQKYFNKHLKADSSATNDTLIYFVKKLSIFGRDTLEENKSLGKANAQLEFKADLVLKVGDDHFAVTRLDTTLVQQIGVRRREITGEVFENMIGPVLNTLQKRIEETDWQKVKERNAYAASTIEKTYYSGRFNLPILVDSAKGMGVYKTFKEFVENKPTIKSFSIQNDKNLFVTLRHDNGEVINPAKIFGYSDGKRLWIQNRGKSFPLIRVGNSFQFFYTLIGNLKILLYVDMEQGRVL